ALARSRYHRRDLCPKPAGESASLRGSTAPRRLADSPAGLGKNSIRSFEHLDPVNFGSLGRIRGCSSAFTRFSHKLAVTDSPLSLFPTVWHVYEGCGVYIDCRNCTA